MHHENMSLKFLVPVRDDTHFFDFEIQAREENSAAFCISEIESNSIGSV